MLRHCRSAGCGSRPPRSGEHLDLLEHREQLDADRLATRTATVHPIREHPGDKGALRGVEQYAASDHSDRPLFWAPWARTPDAVVPLLSPHGSEGGISPTAGGVQSLAIPKSGVTVATTADPVGPLG